MGQGSSSGCTSSSLATFFGSGGRARCLKMPRFRCNALIGAGGLAGNEMTVSPLSNLELRDLEFSDASCHPPPPRPSSVAVFIQFRLRVACQSSTGPGTSASQQLFDLLRTPPDRNNLPVTDLLALLSWATSGKSDENVSLRFA